ncbi:PDR/VanB family oxidoreductase [Bordetella genomosp. 12]|uniref:Oxidoreductase n=1 Tax=Bordetella genomosp. 12 TaxID=463035 RepID=A0A261VDL0_9BORD|nr:PDR/VanB family oxidoreductase [Bordetella genomosp. 12]OZI71670.1 oxidoreductase [Bordetella genomosp. 12]
MNAPASSTALQAMAGLDIIEVQLRAIRLQAQGILAFEFTHPDGAELPAAQAGAHIDVHLPGGQVRSYSLAGDPADRSRWILGVLREPKSRGGSRAMHESLRVGDIVKVGLPRNAFGLSPDGEHAVLLAGGIGITPLKAMAHALAAQGRSFELHYCARTAGHAAFVDELRALLPEGRLHLHFDEGDSSKGLDIAALLAGDEAGRHVYYCGPTGFMAACAQASSHWPAAAVHSEHFKAPEVVRPEGAADGSFDVELSRSGVTVTVQPDQTIVRAMELAGLRVPTSCLSGLCGACKVDYLEGEVDHRDFVLSDEEKEHCLTVCCSRAKSARLVLDY